MVLLSQLEDSPIEWTITKEEALKDALQDGTLEINTAGIQIAGSAIDTDDVSEGTNQYFTTERAQDAVGNNMLTGTQTLITVSYDDVNGELDFVVDNDLSNYDNSTSGFITASGALQNVVEDTTPTLGGTLDASDNDVQNIKLAEFQDEHDNGNSGASATVDWGEGNNQKITLTDNCTLSFTAPSGPGRLQLKVIQDGTGSRTITWPAAARWSGGTAPTLSTAASSVDIVTFWYDGTNYDGVASLNFS